MPSNDRPSRRHILAGAGAALLSSCVPRDIAARSTEALDTSESIYSLTALKALTGQPAYGSVVLLGWWEPGDGGAGYFYWDPNSTRPGNDGTVVAPNGDPPAGRWIRLYSGPLHLDWFGANAT